MNTAPILAVLLTCLAASAQAAELKLLTHQLPPAAYTGGDAQSRTGNEPGKAGDGSLETSFCNGASYPAWLMVDLGSNQSVIKTMTFMEKPGTWYSYKIEVSTDQQTWTMFADQTKNHEPSEDPAYSDMGGVVGRYVRITLTDARDRDKSWFWPVILEFQVWGVAVAKP